jgi:Tfp pilus assembly protein PilV
MVRELSRIEFGIETRRRLISNRRAGFTLTEVVVASALLIVAIVPILKGLTAAHLSTTIIEHKTRSLTLAQGKLDEIRARSIYSYSSTFTESNKSLDGSYLCNVTDSGSGSDLRTITVSVGYDVNGDSALGFDEIEVALTTLIAKRWGG